MNINSVVIAGRLTKDPELKQVGENNLCSFRIASNRTVGKNKVEKSIFIDIDAWGGQAKVCGEFLKKGNRVVVEGLLCQDSWKGKDGTSNSKIFIEASNVMFLDYKNSSSESGESTSSIQREPVNEKPSYESKKVTNKPVAKTENNSKEENDEELPF